MIISNIWIWFQSGHPVIIRVDRDTFASEEGQMENTSTVSLKDPQMVRIMFVCDSK